MFRHLKLLALILLTAAMAIAAPCTYRSQRGNLVSVELRTDPNRAMVYESVNGTTTFLLTKVEFIYVYTQSDYAYPTLDAAKSGDITSGWKCL